MEPSIPTSFIPKRPLGAGGTSYNSGARSTEPNRSLGILGLLAVVSVVATLLSFGGVYLYEQKLSNDKTTLETSINTARESVGSDFVADMQRLNARISGVNALLGSHVVVSPIFAELQATTLRSVQYEQFSYTIAADTQTRAQTVQVELSGNASSYATIALQSDAFTQSKMIKNPVFSGLTRDDKGQKVSFKLVFNVSIEDLSYQKFFEKLSSTQQPAGNVMSQ